MQDVTANIAKQIKKNRERIGLNKKELGKAVGVAPSTVSGGLFLHKFQRFRSINFVR